MVKLHARMPFCYHAGMHVIALVSQKGGAGKTTLAINLAVAAELAGTPAVVIDLDPQASAAAWADSRASDAPVVLSAHAARLTEILATAREHGAVLCLLDTAPHAESPALAAARAADLALIPCRPSIIDLRAVAASRDIARLAGTPAAAVLCAVPPRGTLASEAQAALEAHAFEIAPTRIGHRAAFIHAATAGLGVQELEPRSKAAREIEALRTWIAGKLSGGPS